MSVKTGFRIAVAAASLTAFVGLARAETDYETDYTIGPITLAGSYLAARSADAARDIEAAANFFTAALGNDPENPILMERHGAISDTIDRANHYGDIARDALAIFPESEWKSALLEAVDFCISRAH